MTGKMTGPGTDVDWHNQSIQSDFVHSSLKPANKLDMRGGSFDYEDVVQRRLNEESKDRVQSDLVDLNDVND